MKIFGRNPVMEALKSGKKIERIDALSGGEGSLKKIVGKALSQGIKVEYRDRKALDRESDGENHQGVIAFVAEFEYSNIADIFLRAEDRGEEPFIIILDYIEDPHNLGAIIRSAEGAGAHGVIIPKNRAASVTGTVVKTSAGAVDYIPICRENNIPEVINQLKKRGIWIYALDMDGQDYSSQDLKGPIGLIVGNEGKGISRLVKDKSDFTVTIPMLGQVDSLNASNAAAVLMYEARRQRADR